MTEFRRMLRDRLLDLGAEHVEFVHPGGRHPPRCLFSVGDRQCRLTIPNSPSDHRAIRNAVADARRLVAGARP
jgi:hypothetical protein